MGQHCVAYCVKLSGEDLSRYSNKCSAAAETGDRARAKWTEKWEGVLAPLRGERLGPYLRQRRLGRGLPPYQGDGILIHAAV